MPRLFAGLEVPDLVRERLALVKGPLPGAKWIEPADYHVTLRFAGDIDNRTADEFAGFLGDIELPAFEIRVTGLGAFGGREPRTIHAELDGGPALDQLQRAIERAARSAGLPADPKGFSPHITLARLRGTAPEIVARFLGSRGRLTVAPIPVDRFVLFSSRPRQGGGPYVVEAAFDLKTHHDTDWPPASGDAWTDR